VSGLVLYLGFLGTIQGLKKLDRVAWMHEPPPERFGPDQEASIVIYYKRRTSQKQINNFINQVLECPAEPRHAGRDYPEFVTSYMLLIPPQANGFDGSTLGVRRDAVKAEAQAYIAMIEADPIVEHVFLDVIPTDIVYPQK